MKKNFLECTPEEFETLVKNLQMPLFRAKQLVNWQGKAIQSFSEMTNLPKLLREKIESLYYPGLAQVEQHWISEDDASEKFVLSFVDGEVIEAVLMKSKYGISVCLSTQVGCKMACRFCASSGLHFVRNITCGELLGQFLLLEKFSKKRISNIDLMGIGEPLDNYDEVLAFIRRISGEGFRKISARKICLSTCGLIPRIQQLAEEGIPLTLSISLHAPNQAIREQIMPIAKKYPFSDLLKAAEEYFACTGRRVSYEYAMFSGVNDSLDAASELASVLQGKNCHVNLIPANPIEGAGFSPSSAKQIQAFKSVLTKRGINATVRRSLGTDIEAACGQLRRSSLLAGPGLK